MSKHYIVYKTTNILSGRFYIGVHTTSNVDDGYLGSGKRLKAEIKKYGKQNFVREVLDNAATRLEMLKVESELVTNELRLDPLCLNLKNGGEGGWEFVNAEGKNIRNDFVRDDAYRAKMSKSKIGTKASDETKKKISDATKNRPEVAAKIAAKLRGRMKTKEHCAKIAESIRAWHRERKMQV